MKRRSVKIFLLTILTICCVVSPSYAKKIFMTSGRFYTHSLDYRMCDGTRIKDSMGKYGVGGPLVVIHYADSLHLRLPPEFGVLCGINDTEDPNIKLLTFAFTVNPCDFVVYEGDDLRDIGLDTISTWTSFDNITSIDDYNTISYWGDSDEVWDIITDGYERKWKEYNESIGIYD